MTEVAPTSHKAKPCGLCEKNQSKYCCPRCEVFYCSVDCYKCEKHSGCSENFYRECVTEELAGHHTDEASRRKMIEILKRMNQENLSDGETAESIIEDIENSDEDHLDSDDENQFDLHKRIEGLDLNDPNAIWDALTEDERNEFEALLNQGDVESIIPQWQPWWSYRKTEKLVEDASNIDSEENSQLNKCPMHVEVPEFSTVTKIKPSPTIRFNITNCIAAYAFVMRYFNGDFEAMEGATYMYTICPNLSHNANYENVGLAVESVVQNCLQSNLIQTDSESLEVMRQDVLDIMKGPSKAKPSYYCKSVLSHMITTFREARTTQKNEKIRKEKAKAEFSQKFPENSKEHLPKLESVKIKAVLRKLEFYLSFLESVGLS